MPTSRSTTGPTIASTTMLTARCTALTWRNVAVNRRHHSPLATSGANSAPQAMSSRDENERIRPASMAMAVYMAMFTASSSQVPIACGCRWRSAALSSRRVPGRAGMREMRGCLVGRRHPASTRDCKGRFGAGPDGVFVPPGRPGNINRYGTGQANLER